MTPLDGPDTASETDRTEAALAVGAGVADLAAAAEIEAAEGESLLATCVRHEIALGYRLAMQYAAAGNAALDVARAGGADDAAVPRADRVAARLGGATAHVMGNVRLALLALAGAPAAAGEQWVPVHFVGETLCSPEEAARRLAVAKAARAKAQGLPADDGPARVLSTAERDSLGRAETAADALAVEAGVATLARAAGEWGRCKTFLRHEFAAAHRLLMRLGGPRRRSPGDCNGTGRRHRRPPPRRRRRPADGARPPGPRHPAAPRRRPRRRPRPRRRLLLDRRKGHVRARRPRRERGDNSLRSLRSSF